MHFDIKAVVFNYDVGKNILIEERCGFGFEDVIEAIKSKKLLDIIAHRNKKKYPGQHIFVIKMEDYVYALPFEYKKERNEIVLKTMYPSRKLTREYL